MAELEAELAALDTEYERLTIENEELKNQHEDIKVRNKNLFEQLTTNHTDQLQEDSMQQPSADISHHQYST